MRSPSKALLPLLLAVTLAGACRTSAGEPRGPEETADAIVTALDQGQLARADALFAASARSAENRERLYPKLFEEARTRYEGQDAAGAARVLQHLAKHYPDAVAVHQARAYSLFLERAEAGQADPALVEETAAALAAWRQKAASPPHWIDLIEAQVRIDRGDLAGARAAFERFVIGWNGQPEALAIYVEDVDRYIASH